jgi:4-methyl-5(b-hydroxyethyl)-thiazole monophosphate biosynthesis
MNTMSRVLVPLAPGCEELEAVTITDLLVRAEIDVTTAGLDDQPVVASRGTRIIPDTSLDAVLNESFDMIVLPGGLPGADNLRDDPRLLSLLKLHAEQGKFIAAICAAPKVLAEAGLLDGKKATGYPNVLDALNNPAINVQSSAIVIDGNLITSRGPGTAMDFALSLIELLEGSEMRAKVNQQLVR